MASSFEVSATRLVQPDKLIVRRKQGWKVLSTKFSIRTTPESLKLIFSREQHNWSALRTHVRLEHLSDFQ